jgi:zinc protease
VTLERETRLVFEDRVQVPRLYIAWPTVGENSDDRFALSVLDSILTGTRTTRLTKALVYDQQSASAVNARQSSSEDTGDFRITITPRPGHSLTELEASAEAILEKLKAEGPTRDEIQRATAGLEFDFVTGLQSNLGKSMTLAEGAGIHSNPGYFQTEYQRMLAVTPGDVKRVANKYLTKGRIVLSIVPAGKRDQAAKSSESTPYTRIEQ